MAPKKKVRLVEAEDLADIDSSNGAASNGAAALDAPPAPEVSNIHEAGNETGNETGKETSTAT